MSSRKSHDAIRAAADAADRQTEQRLLTRILVRLLPALEFGQLVIKTPSGERVSVTAAKPGPQGIVVLHRWNCLWRCIVSGDLGFAEGYMAGDWSTPNIVALLDLGLHNGVSLQRASAGSIAFRILNRLQHRRCANTKRGSRRNIAAHYDLGDAFYAKWLDRSMTYSSALFSRPDQSLEDAQQAKIDRAIELMDIKGGERVLEIGCGWGGMTERLIAKHGCTVTGLTLSAEQLAYANRRLEEKGLLFHADLRMQDYRDVQEKFDRIVSIEMLEAVGQDYWPAFFSKLRDCLTPGGTAVLQGITIEESRFESYRRTPDFIQRYIFPGGMLPTVTAMRQEIERAGLALISLETFGQSYARTLAAWQQRFQRAWPDIQPSGFGLPFKRMWEYYLAYCEAGFKLGAVDVGLYRIKNS